MSSPVSFDFDSLPSSIGPLHNYSYSNSAVYRALSNHTSTASPADTMDPLAQDATPAQYVFSQEVQELRAIIERQTEAMHAQREAHRLERETWDLNRARLNRRIASLEQLLRPNDTHSPAGSPQFAPYQGFVTLAPHPRVTSSGTTTRLPSIAEDAPRTQPLTPPKRTSSMRRDSAPTFIAIPKPAPGAFAVDGQVEASTDALSELIVSPPRDLDGERDAALSPPPSAYTEHAGHTPLKMPSRPSHVSTPSSVALSENTVDLVTESNTLSNVQTADHLRQEADDAALQGPLRMPQLPTEADSNTFTVDALTARLQQIEDNPHENEPAVLRASPIRESRDE